MIYSASRRTDLPAFYPDHIVAKVRRSRKLEAIVFWTKDVRNLARHPDLGQITKNIPCIVQFTVTGLAGTRWEPSVPELRKQADEARELAARLPQGAVRWRFDPAVAVEGLEELKKRFLRVRDELLPLLGAIGDVTTSFPDPYRRAAARVREAGLPWPALDDGEKRDVVAFMARNLGGSPVRLCCEPELLEMESVGQARCVDGGLFRELYGLRLDALPKDKGQRAACGCMLSTDIGTYDMACGHGCLYCYANPK